MNELSRQTGCLVLAAAALLAGCGGGSDQESAPMAAARGTSQVPASALQSPQGLAAFQRTLSHTGTDSTSDPLILGDAVLPVSDHAEPVAVN